MSDPGTRPPRARSGSRRDEAARLAVVHAADDLLVELGFKRLTVEAIARRAGVAKQTIYRWWPSKVEILLDTLVEDAEKRLTVPTEATARNVRDYFRRYARFLDYDPAGAVLLALVAEAQQDPASAVPLRERFHRPRRARERHLLEAAAAAGEIPDQADPDLAIDAVLGPLVYRALLGTSTRRGLVDRLVDETIGLRVAGSPRRRNVTYVGLPRHSVRADRRWVVICALRVTPVQGRAELTRAHRSRPWAKQP